MDEVVVQAEEVITALAEEDRLEYSLHDAQIAGSFDLKHRTLNIALDLQGCAFLDEVDLRYCEFKQAVNFSDCTFRKYFNSGDETESHTVFRKDLICNRTVFTGGVSFNGCLVEGSAYFNEAYFVGTERPVVFSWTSIEKVLECHRATFEGTAYFNSLCCNALYCNEATFQGPASFARLTCNASGYFPDAEFLSDEEVDFSYASFNEILQFGNARFEGPAIFNSIRCGANGIFPGTEFRSSQEVNFVGASFGGNFDCSEATFNGSATFNSMKCSGAGSFVDARFEGEGEVNFGHASFGRGVNWSRCTFRGPATFAWMQCGDLTCEDVTFEDIAVFHALKCDGSGFLSNTRFEGEGGVDFGHASFTGSLYCDDATFSGLANFNTLTCGDIGRFQDVEFHGEVDFNLASFGTSLACNNSTFYGPANFKRLQCADSAFFRHTRFEGATSVDLLGAYFKVSVEFTDAVFEGSARFNRVECEGTGRFDGVRFESEDKVDFESCSFGLGLVLRGVRCAGPVVLVMGHVSTALDLRAAHFQQKFTLYGTTVGRLMLGDTSPFQEGNLDLRGCSIDGFHGSKEAAKEFVQAQDPSIFSRDPYLQLEKHYSNIGDEVEAKEIHYQGRRDLRENAKDQRGSTNWSRRTSYLDWAIKWLTGYGVKTGRLLVPIFFFLILGTAMFWSDDALRAKASTTPAAPSGISETSLPSDDMAATSTLPEEEENSDSWGHKLFDRSAYSFDLFLPVVNLHIDERWEPQGLGREIYAFIHAAVGWLLVPLLVASLAGIVRRQ